SIQGYAETLLDAVPDAGHSREFLEIIRKNATRMSRLTEDLLTLARVESGEHRFDVQPVTTSELLNEAVRSFQEIARSQHVELRIEDHAATQVSADSEAVHQVFANLVENALKYGASGGLIVVGARPAGEFVEFYVQDCGPGIPSEHLPRLQSRSEEHTSELQSPYDLVCRLLLEKKKEDQARDCCRCRFVRQLDRHEDVFTLFPYTTLFRSPGIRQPG